MKILQVSNRSSKKIHVIAIGLNRRNTVDQIVIGHFSFACNLGENVQGSGPITSKVRETNLYMMENCYNPFSEVCSSQLVSSLGIPLHPFTDIFTISLYDGSKGKKERRNGRKNEITNKITNEKSNEQTNEEKKERNK